MKKIILAFDGQHLSDNVLRAVEFLQRPNALFVGVFVVPRMIVMDPAANLVYDVDPNDLAALDGNITKFEQWCQEHNLNYRVRREDTGFGNEHIIAESRFADLLIVDGSQFYRRAEDVGSPSAFLIDLLRRVECPTFVVPSNFVAPRKAVIAYNGTSSSVFAMRQFAYVFRASHRMDVALLYVSRSVTEEVPDEELVRELASCHFGEHELVNMTGRVKEVFKEVSDQHPGALWVMGAYGRGWLSELFSSSAADQLLHQLKVPIFFAH